MRTDRSALWFRQLVLVASILALCVVGLGAYVRLSDAGLGCPDWPGCFGSMTVPQSEAAILHAQEEVKGRGIPEWIQPAGELGGKVISMPTREQINLPVQEQLIVELYSK